MIIIWGDYVNLLLAHKVFSESPLSFRFEYIDQIKLFLFIKKKLNIFKIKDLRTLWEPIFQAGHFNFSCLGLRICASSYISTLFSLFLFLFFFIVYLYILEPLYMHVFCLFSRKLFLIYKSWYSLKVTQKLYKSTVNSMWILDILSSSSFSQLTENSDIRNYNLNIAQLIDNYSSISDKN